MANNFLMLDGNSLTTEKIERFLSLNQKVKISTEAKQKINRSRKLVEKWVKEDKIIYGINTGFGELANVKISKQDIQTLQKNLILSHAVGCGEPLPPAIVKTMMLLRLNALAKGFSGVRLSTLELLVEMINNNLVPFVPSQGSVGSSGDLVQLSHLVLAMIGEGKIQKFNSVLNDAFDNKKIVSSKSIFKKYNLSPVVLEAKEGLALINGTQMMTAYAAYISFRANRLKKLADISAALSHEALRSTDKAFDYRIHSVRPYKGQKETAENILKLIANSEIRKSHLTNDSRVQDAYSIRCIPQIHGASRDAIDYVTDKVNIEINSANDNPLIFADTESHLEGGNFHGQPMALAMDFMAISLAEFCNVSERRIERLVNGALSNGLPKFLIKNSGINSGFMIAQYTAASIVSENKVLAHPASVDSIPTSANQEDHNSMGSIAAQKCYKILQNLESVIAIELLCATQGIDFLLPLKCGVGTDRAYKFIRKHVKHLNKDRLIYNDIQSLIEIIKNDSLLNEVESVVELN